MKNALFLAQSDTTAGFLSADSKKIIRAKQNGENKNLLRESASIGAIKEISRIPQVLNKAIRRRKKTTFIFPNAKSFRVVLENSHFFCEWSKNPQYGREMGGNPQTRHEMGENPQNPNGNTNLSENLEASPSWNPQNLGENLHLKFLKNFGILYSSSANLHNKSFDKSWAESVADVIIYDNRGIFEYISSHIFQIKKNKIKKIR
ncbi:hypothetical protein CCY99_02210 [Helicobacter sp. 16-1353]|uniref:hypothetical protein n=1 Tax=Helicobacter sp. 16-1353 TaxID=2004996 RepID=UPI000DCC73C2|nr:hypothetical protein [Helicobacter sp. 16-1353]RAX54973.1 hypothetical protein CCY99_02210 [Helicobacter sp. 16-1353]